GIGGEPCFAPVVGQDEGHAERVCASVVYFAQFRTGRNGYHDERAQYRTLVLMLPFVVKGRDGEQTAAGTLDVIRPAQSVFVVVRFEESRHGDDAAAVLPQLAPRPR